MLIYSCSGGADVGALTDRVARYLTLSGAGSMHCLAGIGAGLDSFIEKAGSAPGIIAIDGCPVNCAKQGIEKYNLEVTHHFQLGDLGFAKGESPADAENTKIVVDIIEKAICNE